MALAGARPLELMTEEERAFHASRDQKMLSSTDEGGRTLLHIAAQNGKAAICRLYLNAGIDPSKIDNAGRTAADMAKLAGYASLSRSLENAIADYAAMSGSAPSPARHHPLDVNEQRALIAGQTEILVSLISGNRLDSKNAKGDTPLHLAAAGGHLHLCSQLFEAGADTLSRNDNGQTPADMASEAGHRRLAEMLRTLNHKSLDHGARAGSPVAEAKGDDAEVHKPEIDDTLGELEFTTEEEPVAFHSRQGIDGVSSTFVAFPSKSGIRAGGSTDEENWELPPSLVKVRTSDHVADRAGDSPAGAGAKSPDFSSSNGRTRRRPRKLESTSFRIDEFACRLWVRSKLTTGEADDLDVRELVGMCRGNHSPDELALNVSKVLEAAGIRTEELIEPFLQLHSPSTTVVDEDVLVEAIVAACTRNAAVPGRQAFSVDRATEKRLVREISNARHELLNAILDEPALISAIVLCGEKVLGGELAVDAFTDLELEVAEGESVDGEFCTNLETLREVQAAGVAIGGRSRRRAMEALDGLELCRSCLNELVQGSAEKVRDAICRLLAVCDRSTETLLLAHLSFARRETAKMALPGEDPEELFQEAYFALRRAVERFDPSRGVRFYLYALFWIRQQISRWRANNMSLIRVPVHRYELNSKIRAFREEFEGQFHRSPTDSEISQHIEYEVKVIKAIALALSEPIEFDQVMSGHADNTESPEEMATQHQLKRVVHSHLNSLTPREEAIIRMRFGIGLRSDMTLEEIGGIYDVTRERVRQIEAKALRKLSHPSRSRILAQLK
jgi:RNA polymerase primary sigma factor